MSLFGWKLPSRAAIGAGLLALLAGLLTAFKRDVRRNARKELELDDHENADAIEDRVDAARRQRNGGVRDYADRGWRD